MPSTETNQTFPKNAAHASADPVVQADLAGKPVVIATRKRCEADGVGLSHYVLMDRKARK